MKWTNLWRSSQKAAGILCMTAALAACTALSPIASSSGPEDNKIAAGCVWPGLGQRVTYVTTKGDLYQVETGREHALIQASIKDNNVVVYASYDAFGPLFDPGTNTRFGLKVHRVVSFSGSVAPPPENALLSNQYQLAAAAHLAQYGFYEDRSKLPTAICSSQVEVNGYRRPFSQSLPGQFSPLPF